MRKSDFIWSPEEGRGGEEMYETLLGIAIMSLTVGLVIIAIGVIKAFKSKFYDLDSLMWLIIGWGFTSFASILAKYL